MHTQGTLPVFCHLRSILLGAGFIFGTSNGVFPEGCKWRDVQRPGQHKVLIYLIHFLHECHDKDGSASALILSIVCILMWEAVRELVLRAQAHCISIEVIAPSF